MFENLAVLHIKGFNAQKADLDVEANADENRSPLSLLTEQWGGFALETCARTVILFHQLSSEQAEHLERGLSETGSLVELLKAEKAYAFLLRWGAGIVSQKISHNDHFVLGAIRAKWGRFQFEQSDRAKPFIPMMTNYLHDLSKVRDQIQKFLECSSQVRQHSFSLLCASIAHLRHSGKAPVYVLDITDEQREALGLQERLKKLNRRIQASIDFYEKYGASVIDLEQKNQKYYIFRSGLEAAYDKHRLLKKSAAASDKPVKRQLPLMS